MPTRARSTGNTTPASTRAAAKPSTLEQINSLKLKPGAKPEQLRVVSSLEMNTSVKGQSVTLVNNMGTLQLLPKKGDPHDLTSSEKKSLVKVLEPMMKTAPADVREVLDTFLDLTGFRTAERKPTGWSAGGPRSERSTVSSREASLYVGGRGSDQSTSRSRERIADISSGGRRS